MATTKTRSIRCRAPDMDRTNEQVLVAARRWLGTPYVHQASVLGAGCDCLGLIRGIWREVLGGEPADVPPYTADWSEASKLEALWQAAEAHLQPRELCVMQPGNVLLFRMRTDAVAKHLGVLSASGATPRFIHAFTGHGVVESPLSTPWQRRIVACFEFPERTS